jgi:Flp pilus assembly protein TadD
VPGVRYSVRVTPHVDHSPQEAWFELAGPERTREVRAALALLKQELASTTSPNTVAALQAGYLANTGLLDEARRLVVAALTRDPDEPTLHLILGNVYAQTGLTRQARQSYDEARFLMRSRPTR